MAQSNVSNSAEKKEEENQKISTAEEDLESEKENKRSETLIKKEAQHPKQEQVSVQLFNKYQKQRQKYYNA